MATDANKIVIPGRVRAWLADVGTAFPVDCVVAPAVAWTEVGYTVEDGTSFTTDPSFGEVRSHQSDHPTRRMLETETAAVAMQLQEWSDRNFQAVFGGGTVTEVLPATIPKTWKFVPPTAGGRVEKALLLEAVDGAKVYRWAVPRVFQSEGVELNLVKTSEATLPLRLGVLGSDVGDPWYLITNDQAFDPAT
jgi:hypothetical protein